MTQLPDAAHLKLARIKQLSGDAKALLDGVHRAIQVNEGQCTDAANRVRSAGSNASRAAAQRELDLLRTIHEEKVQERAKYDALAMRRAQLVARLEAALSQVSPGRSFRMAAARVRAYAPETLAQTRSKITDCDTQVQRIAMLPLARASLEAGVTKRVQDMRSSCRIAFVGLRGDASLDFKLEGTERGLHKPTGEELLAWLNPEALTAQLLAALPREDGMSLREKQDRTRQMQAEKLALERIEEALIEAAHSAGVSVERRVDADWRAVLKVTLSAAREVEAA